MIKISTRWNSRSTAVKAVIFIVTFLVVLTLATEIPWIIRNGW